jgi:hypothetical protein
MSVEHRTGNDHVDYGFLTRAAAPNRKPFPLRLSPSATERGNGVAQRPRGPAERAANTHLPA